MRRCIIEKVLRINELDSGLFKYFESFSGYFPEVKMDKMTSL